ncbi:MAG: PAS domain-containing protein, partial [Gemmatimonadota bacterium]
MFGVRAAEFTGSFESFLSLVHPDDQAAMRVAQGRVLAGEGPLDFVHRIVLPSGEIRHIRERAELLSADGGRPQRLAGTSQDITEQHHAQEATRRLAAGLTSTLESITDAFYTVDRDWRFTYVNHEAVRVLRHPRVDLLGGSVWELFPEARGTEFQHQFERAVADNAVVQFEEYYPPLGGWFEVRAYPSAQGLAVHFRDITEQHRVREELRGSEEALRQRTQQLQLALGAARMGVWRWDLQTKVVTTLQGGGPVSGLPDGLRPIEMDAVGALVHPDDRAAAGAIVRQALKTGQPCRAEFRVVVPDRGVRWVSALGQCTCDAAGKPQVMIGVDSDITERKRAEQALVQQAALIDEARDAILVRDLEHRISFWSKGAERLYGWTSAEATGRRVDTLLCVDAARFKQGEAAVLRTGAWSGELLTTTKSGTVRTMDCRWTLLHDEQGGPKSILTIDTDITDRKVLEQQFLRAQRMESIGTLAGGIAHDLNNVLTPILLAVELLRTESEETERQELLDTLATSARHGAEMVRQVLTFARGVPGERLEVQIGRLLTEIERITRDTFPKNVRTSTRVDSSLWNVAGDPTQLHQVLLNLCVNARDAMPDGGSLTLSAENVTLGSDTSDMHVDARPGPYVLIRVEDTGAGMSREVVEQVFDPFFTTKAPGKGTGLGLSTSLAIVKSHGGFILVASEPDKGTRFRVYLPARLSTGPATEPVEQAALPRGNNELVLVVDDEASVRQLTRQTLEAFGYRVLLASNGAEAIGIYAQHREEIAVVVTDMMMPIMDGPATIRNLLHINARARIIAASGLGDNVKLGGEVGVGIRHFLSKPYTAESLLTALRQTLEEQE